MSSGDQPHVVQAGLDLAVMKDDFELLLLLSLSPTWEIACTSGQGSIWWLQFPHQPQEGLLKPLSLRREGNRHRKLALSATKAKVELHQSLAWHSPMR